MTSRAAYTYFTLLANKLLSNDNVNIDIGRFCYLYNKNALIWLEQRVRKTKANQKIDEIQQLFVKEKPLTLLITFNTHANFAIPYDWFDFSGGFAVCSNPTLGCTDVQINAAQVKNDNQRLILFDENMRPDWDTEWLPITIGQDAIQVYYKDFTVQKFFMDYYRFPRPIDIVGYKKPDGTASVNIDPDIDDIYVNEILDLAVLDVSRIYENQEKAQLDINRIQQEQ